VGIDLSLKHLENSSSVRKALAQMEVVRETKPVTTVVFLDDPPDSKSPSSAFAAVDESVPSIRIPDEPTNMDVNPATDEPVRMPDQGPLNMDVNQATVVAQPRRAMGVSGAEPSPSAPTVGNNSNSPMPARKRISHYLHDLGIFISFYDGKDDERPCYSSMVNAQGVQVRMICVNKAHRSYQKCAGSSKLEDHVLRLIANEIVLVSYPESSDAIALGNKIYASAILREKD
jgi:hypothetical protein